MRGVKAKRLRRAAERATVGLPARRLAWRGNGRDRDRNSSIINHPQSTRAVYLRLKEVA